MSRRVNTEAMGQILEALFLLRSSRLAEASTDGSAPSVSSEYSTQKTSLTSGTAVDCARHLLRDSVLSAIEIESTQPDSSSLLIIKADPSVTAKKSAYSLSSSAAWRPRKEIGTVLEGRDLHRIDLSGTRLSASFNRSDLSEAILIGTYFAHCTFNLCDLRKANLAGAQFYSCTFLSTDASAAAARRAHFSHCVFHRADLSDWDAAGATFFQCSFTLSDLSRWSVDGQTTVVKPTSWGRCRRLDWVMRPGSSVRECRVVGDANTTTALSLAPAEKSSCNLPRGHY
ncbi:putative Pentapeptide repeat (8 copies)/Pentapeptide repeat (9 copies) [Leishmania naiffi]|uniref:Pentapeptide repeat (8 copies)/Pentapeptide repeat (9 copies) n=1 Tax=Leishmania naiffi TaxID=5678 RepID=A0AAW3B3U0_9TRYP